MKYIDLELMDRTCDFLNNPNRDEDEILWKECLKNYDRYLETIKSRFPKRFYAFFTKTGMHDSILQEFKIVKRHLKSETRIDIITKWTRCNCKPFVLTFKDVKQLNTSIDLTAGYAEFGDFIIGEFSAVDENYLSFEFLFFNDSTIKLVFKKLQFQINKDPSAKEAARDK